MSGVWVILEEQQTPISRAGWEAVAAGQQLAALAGLPVHAAILGAATAIAADEVRIKALSRVVRVEDPLLANYSADAFSQALLQLIAAETPNYVVFPHTWRVRDYAPAVAAHLGQCLIVEVTAIDDGPVFTRQLRQGRMNGLYRYAGSGPCLLSVQAGAFPQDLSDGSAEVAIFTPRLQESSILVRTGECFRGPEQSVNLENAEKIVGVGRGIRESGNLAMMEELAEVLQAELGATRPVCDYGWVEGARQIGSSGQSVAPRLYVAVGISGAIQHLAGIGDAQYVVAINKDPNAPIFSVADCGIVGDLFEVVPALIEAVKAAKNQ
jgi:electron transfer flavoprotein alpha subunit